MNYTIATEKDKTIWSLSEFIEINGDFSIIQEATIGNWYGRFNNRGVWTHVHIESKAKGTPISYILKHQDEYNVEVVVDEYCLYKVGDAINFSEIQREFGLIDDTEYTAQDYYMDNPDIFDGEIV
jgi:hypothetical protein